MLTASKTEVTGNELKSLIADYHSTSSTIERLSKRFSPEALNKLLEIEPIVEEDLQSTERTQRVSALLEAALSAENTDIVRFEVSSATDQPGLKVTKIQYGLKEETIFSDAFFRSSEYRSMVTFAAKLKEIEQGDGELTATWGETEQVFERFKQSVEWMMSRAKKGFSIQRYKGLGEMNPEQLWDTTMDPTVRRLLQVTIDDQFGADETFTTLMGDQVEPRRAFIEDNAFAVSNLDV